jgi:hypothetical protein
MTGEGGFKPAPTNPKDVMGSLNEAVWVMNNPLQQIIQQQAAMYNR